MMIELTAEDNAYMPASEQRVRYLAHHPRSGPMRRECALLAPPPLPLPASPPLPQIKPLEQRLAEAEALRGTIAPWLLKDIKRNILDSAAEFGETLPVPEFHLESPQNGVRPIARIQTIVADHFNISRDVMLSSRRHRRITYPRHIAMYLAKLLTPHSLPAIGRLFGGRDHTTVLHSVRKITVLVESDKAFADEISVLREMLMIAVLNGHEPFYWGA